MKTSPINGRPPQVSIIIPVFNKSALTVQCLKALGETTSHVPHEIIVVDNASTDDTPARMQNQPAHIRYIRNETNRNFAGACNQGAAAAAGKFLLFLNNDTIPTSGWLDPLLEEMRAHPEVAAVGSKLLYQSGLIQHAGVIFDREARSPFHPYRLLRIDNPRVNHRRELQAVTAACVLMRPQWFTDCGGFSEDYKNGYEDLDLCLKIRQRGGVIVYQPKSVVFHLESQTPGRMKFDNENRALFFQRWQHAVLSDEDAYYFADGCYKIGIVNDRPEAPNLVRFANDAEKKQWQHVAQSQMLAAAWQRPELEKILSDHESWPQNAAVRRWAGCLAHRLRLKDIAQKHFAAASSHDPEWTTALDSGFKSLRSGDPESAQKALNLALFQGAPPNIALTGLWQAGRQLNSTSADTQQIGQALQFFSRLDPDAAKPTALKVIAPQGTPKMRPDTKLVSIVILVLNQLEHTRACLESIAAHTSLPHEIIIVDNASTDGTSEFLKSWQAAHPNCVVIRNESNRGFAGGNNQGLAQAKGDQVLLLNNDTIVTAGWLEAMLAVYAHHLDTGLVGPVSNRVSGPQLVREATYKDTAGMHTFAAGYTSTNAGRSTEVVRAVGFCLLATREVITRIGGLDESFGSGNFEDDDFCLRARFGGYRIRIAHDSFVHHVGSQTFIGQKIDYRQSMQRNWDIFRTKWQLPAEASLERGYPVPAHPPKDLVLNILLPVLTATHDRNGRHWIEKKATKPVVTSAKTSPVAKIGALAPARDLFGKKQFASAWQATINAIVKRPFHPEAFLLLAEIALAAGDAASARQCAKLAQSLAPGWKPAKQFLNQPLNGNTKPDWLKLPEKNSISLSVCLIVKNEEKFLDQCLKSIRGLAQQIIVVDTGSTDRTVEIAREHGAEIHSFTWCNDFAAARNAALEHAVGDWILMLDADEELPAEQHARLAADLKKSDALGLRLPLVNLEHEAEGQNFVPRLFHNAPGIFYTGRVHEQIFPSLVPLSKSWGLTLDFGTAQLLHHGYTRELVRDRKKIERNLELLRQAIAENANDTNLMMNYGLELVRSGDLAGGVEKYRRAFELMSAAATEDIAPELREVLLTQFTCQLYKLRAHDEVLRVLQSPLAESAGLTASLHFAAGLALFELKQFAEAAAQMRECIGKRHDPILSPINTDVRTNAPEHCLALSLAKTGDAAGAEKAFQLAMAGQGQSENIKLDYARFLAAQNRGIEAFHQLHELVAANPRNVDAWKTGGEIALSRPEFLEFARDWTQEAVRHATEDFTVNMQRAEALLLSGDAKNPVELWEKLWNSERQPAILAALILCELLESRMRHAPDQIVDEPSTSRAFIKWYQKLIALRAYAAIKQINTRLEELLPVLPTASRMLEKALSQPQPAAA